MRDIEADKLFDARDVLTESQCLLDAYLLAHPATVARPGKPAKPNRAA